VRESLKTLWWRLRAWPARRAAREDFSRELRGHLELLAQENIRRGMPQEEARRAARIRLGGMTQLHETHREQHGWRAAETLLQDIRYALRTLRKSLGFTAICVLTLGLGVGACTAIFSVVNGVLLRPLPYPNHDRLVRIGEQHSGNGCGLCGNFGNVTYANFNDLERVTHSVENLSAFREWLFNFTGDGAPEQTPGAMVSGTFFAALGTAPVLGRVLLPEDDVPRGDNHVAVLSYSLWQRRFAADRGIIGKTLRINAENYRVVGVMPRGFDYPQKSEVWCPLVPHGEARNNRRAHLLTVVADVRSDQALASAQAEIAAIGQRIEKQNASEDPDMTLVTVSLKKNIVAPVQPALLVLLFAVALLLLMACANLANLLLARAASRSKEFALRSALGAGRVRLVRQLLTESFVVAILGSTLGFAIAAWSLQFISALDSHDLPRFGELHLDWRVFAFAIVIAALSGLLFGLAPALTGAKTELNVALKEGAAAALGGRRRGASQALLVPQFALAALLLVGAGLVANSFVRLLRVNPGFRYDGVLAAELFLSPTEYPERDVRGAMMLQQMLEHVRAVPGVRSAGLVTALPITGGADTDFFIEGRPLPPANDEPSADIRSADTDYFRTMGIPLLAGREFTAADTATSNRVMVINETMARLYWPNASPIGQHVTMKDWGPPLSGEIIGVVGDVKANGLDTAVMPMIYWSYFQFPQLFNSIVVRTGGDPQHLTPAVKAAIWSVNKNQPISQMATMADVLSESLARRRLYLILLGVFAASALILAAVGVYGMVAYSVSQRIREMGIRIAVGAARGDVLRMVLGQGARVAILGIAAGILAALALTRLMASLLFGVTATDPLTFLAVAALLTLVALGASFLPARRATRVDPMVALRSE